MRFSQIAGAVSSFAAACVLTGGLAFAQTNSMSDSMHSDSMMSSSHGTMMRADGTMMMSDGMMKMSHDMMMMTGSCQSMMAMMHKMMMGHMMTGAVTKCFKVRIDNVSSADAFTASNGTKWTLPFSPGVFAVSSKGNPIFATGSRDRGQGLRSLAEDGDGSTLATYVEHAYPGSGAFLVPVGGSKPKGILPGESFEFYAVAQPGQKLYLATMFGQSNDWFYATPSGIALFDAEGKPVGGDATSSVKLYDAGTEADQELGVGSTQGPRQPHPRYGPDDPNTSVRLATTDKRFVDVTQVMRVTVTPQ
jgi:hypothetical protein